MIYDAEHFFDGYRDDPEYALRCLDAALEAGAENVTLCDTNGSSLPAAGGGGDCARGRRECGAERVGIHTHNDAECGVANSIAAVEEGAALVQGTMNGIGERCGNANLVSILPSLQLKLGLHACVSDEQLASLTQDRPPRRRALQPDAGPEPALRRPQRVRAQGRHARRRRARRRRARSSTSSRRSSATTASCWCRSCPARAPCSRAPRRPGSRSTRRPALRAVERLKELEHRGYHFEAADASFDLLLRKEAGDYEPLFRLESFRVITEKREDGKVQTEATIKIWAEGERLVRTAEGNGPVNALDRALRDAIADIYPRLRDIDLVNYKVRIIDEHKGTGAVTRVLIDASDGRRDLGHDRRLREHHRGELGGARRLPRILDAAESRAGRRSGLRSLWVPRSSPQASRLDIQ